ncbi:phosphotransferase family enzyme [Lentzea atacamensis]|uniref:Phosphotransferase family enzyme n=1 Tax=Lentzea atacamensis TaxID=531938 RepID=A0ABX9E7C6_9PSEU|nr:phosphotransferase [Lentzea atacamensis]RAS63780.1 phosphotransferase family enzyme [Lentzea atacamensis]
MEERLDGGNAGGAVRVGDTVRKPAAPWTPAVHELLDHLRDKGFSGAPRAVGIDERGREILTSLDGETIGNRRPWPRWVHADETLDQVGGWLRAHHRAVADFAPSSGAVWRGGGRWEPGLLVGHNDAAPYNAAWRDGRLTGFFDWDFAGPVTAESDLAFAAFSWVPLHARHVVEAEGFTDFAVRPRRLRRFLTAYGWSGQAEDFLDVVRARIIAQAEGIRGLTDDPVFAEMVRNGVVDSLDRAVEELDGFTVT